MALAVTKQNLQQKITEAPTNPYIAYEIGEYYYSLANYEKAVEWYEKAASGSSVVPMALYALGYACQYGEGTAVDLFQALQYYEEAAKKDIPQACYNLAYFYQNGIGVCRDQNKANRYCERASESLRRLVDASQKTKEQLHIAKAKLEACRDRISELEYVEINLREQHQQLLDKNNGLLQKTEKLVRDNAAKETYVLELEKKLKEQQTELTEQKAELAEQKRLHARVTQDIENISKSQHALEADLASQIRRLDGERAALSEGLRQKEAAIRDLNEDLRKKEDTLAGMANTLAEKEEALAEKENQRAFLQDICAKQRKKIKHVWCGLAGLAILVLLIIF